jgi:pyruvate/2-oxoglutarate dehydrogenase complex dihydrolipoamide acyltransferase (E2) component
MKHSAALVLGLAIVMTATLAFAQAATQRPPATAPSPSAPSAAAPSTTTPSAPPPSAAAPSAPSAAREEAGAAAGAATGAPGRITAEDLNRHLQQAGVSEQMSTQIKYVMLAQVQPFDPAHVLAIKDDLKLTDDQMNKLNSMIQKAHDDTRALLTDDQKRIVQQVRPMTVADATAQLPPSVSSMLMAQARGGAPAGTPGATSAPGMRPPSSSSAQR